MRTLFVVAAALALTLPIVAASGPRATASSGGFVVTVQGATQAPRAGERWSYMVRAIDAAGRPVAGTAVLRVLVGGRIVAPFVTASASVS